MGSCQFSKNSLPCGPAKVKTPRRESVRVRTVSRGTVRVKSIG